LISSRHPSRPPILARQKLLRLILALPLIGIVFGVISNPNLTVANLFGSSVHLPVLIVRRRLRLEGFRHQLSFGGSPVLS